MQDVMSFESASDAEKKKVEDFMESLSFDQTCDFYHKYRKTLNALNELKTKEAAKGKVVLVCRLLWMNLAKDYPEVFTNSGDNIPVDGTCIEYEAYRFIQKEAEVHLEFMSKSGLFYSSLSAILN